ncbi:MAG: iron-sulfur cluster assembly protein [Halorhabdus sp.]
MTEAVSTDDVEAAIADVTHPEIDATLLELGMIDDVRTEDEEVTIDVAIPMAGIPDAIKQLLARRLADALDGMDIELTVQFVLMDEETRETFFEMEEDNWSGLDGEDGPDEPVGEADDSDSDAPF